MKRSYSLISSSSKPRIQYDVFLSFRGEDSRNTFTSHLYAALRQKGIFTFLDDDNLERGESISPKLMKAIENSSCSVILISENYASSSWCLTELVKILECREIYKQIVLPIFYHVDPSHVRKQSGSIGEAFEKHEQVFSHNLEKVQSWRDALKEVGNLAGWHLHDGNEAKFIQDFIVHVSSKLGVAQLNISEDLFGMDSRLEKLSVCVCTSSLDDVHFIGICGLGGIGKTTIARAYYDWMCSQFEGCSFLPNVRKVCEKKENGLVHLQNHLLSDILNGLPRKARDVHEGKNIIRSRLRHKKVLVVLDDVDKLDQLDALAEKNNWFGRGSTIIVTTRDESLVRSTYKECSIYRVEEFNYSEALGLFSHKAFKSTHPSKDYEELCVQVIAYAHGLPLALEVLGSFLCGKSVNQWKSALDRLKEYPNKEVMKVLQISFDGLEEIEKSIFLDIACFFNGLEKDKIIQIMDSCDFYPEIGIKVLIDKSLLYVGAYDKLWMHDLLQEMGKEIVRGKPRNEPGKRTRIWDCDDLCHVLEYNMGTEVEAIVCDSRQHRKLVCDCEAFSNMKKLRLLIIDNLVLEMRDGHTLNIEYLPKELRFLKWHQFPATYLPSNFQRGGLVELKLWLSKHLWNNTIKPLNNLKFTVIDISYSTNLRKFEDFGVVPNLEQLILKGCVNLLEIHPSITLLKSLKVLNLEGCASLTSLPQDLGLLHSLEELNMRGISVRDEDLPSSIALLGNLKTLSCSGGRQWTNMMNIIVGKGLSSSAGLFSLKTLELISCGLGNGAFPENFDCLVSLESLDLSNNDFSCLPLSFNKLFKLRHLGLRHCSNLKSLGPELPPGLEWVGLDYCFSLETFLDPLMNEQCNLGCSASFLECLKLARRKSCERTAFTLLKRHLQNHPSRNERFDIFYPGNEIPSWFIHPSFQPSVILQLDRNRCKSKWIGLAFFACFFIPTSIYECRVIGEEIGCGFEITNLHLNNVVSEVGASVVHIWLLYIPLNKLMSDHEFRDWENNNFSDQLHFSFYSLDWNGRRYTQRYIRSCGVRWVYEQDIEDMNPISSNRIEYPFRG